MIYVVQPGDDVFSIAQQFGISPCRIIYDNQLQEQETLAAGQALLIRYLELPELKRTDNMRVTGYALPNINEYVLDEALNYLDEVIVFSYGFTPTGELIPPDNVFWITCRAWRSYTRPMLALAPFGDDGNFNNQLIHALVTNEQAQQTLIQNLLETVEREGYAGVDVDFEFILPEDKEGYAAFLGRLTEKMNAYGYSTSVALAPKTSDDQPGLIYEAMDYRLLSEQVNTAFLMTYEWGYTYGPPLPVAPLDKVKQVLDYALTRIPRQKLMLGIPNYGYDWPLPYERGVTAATSIGNVEAPAIAAERGATILYDETAQSPHFNYTSEGVEHEVWFEDVRSIQKKIELAKDNQLLGVGYWNLMRPFRANWLILQQVLNNILIN